MMDSDSREEARARIRRELKDVGLSDEKVTTIEHLMERWCSCPDAMQRTMSDYAERAIA